LRVYNRNNNAVEVSAIRLLGGADSPYRLTVNGQEGKSFSDVYIRGKDSIYILVNVDLPTPQPVNTPFLVDDKIEFLTNGNTQSVHLRSWGQDAIFYQDSLLDCDLVWSGDKPVVLINSVGVAENCKLTIEAGTKVYLDNASSILVFGTLEVKGTFENPVTFSGIRLEEEFENIPGQWGNAFSNAIWFFEGSENNTIQWAEIKNATTGIRIGSVYDQQRPDLRIENTIIKNMAGDGIISFGADLTVHNSLITNCGLTGVSILLGGNAELYHNTIANYSFTFNREDPGMLITDFFPDSLGTGIETNPLTLDMQNNVVWGSLENEWGFNFQSGGNQLIIDYNYLRITDPLIRDFLDGTSNIIQSDVDNLTFRDFRDYDLQLDTLSPAKDVGNPAIIPLIGPDLNNANRIDGLPDMGAYERED
jgi:hypothetical protein